MRNRLIRFCYSFCAFSVISTTSCFADGSAVGNTFPSQAVTTGSEAILVAENSNSNAKQEEATISLSIEGGRTYSKGHEISYDYDVDEADEMKTPDSDRAWYISGIVGYQFGRDSALSDFGFGDQPRLQLGVKNEHFDSSMVTTNGTGAFDNSPLRLDGVIEGTNFVGGDFYSDFQSDLWETNFSLIGNRSEGWSFAPELGVTAGFLRHDYNLYGVFRTAPSKRRVIDGDLESRMYGGFVGLEVATPSRNGLRFTAKPSVNVSRAYTRFKAVMDPNKHIGGWTDGLTVDDFRDHVVVDSKLTVGAEYSYKSIVIGANLSGALTYGEALMDMPDRVGDPANIETDDTKWALGGGLNIKFYF